MDLFEYLAGPPTPPDGWHPESLVINFCNCRPGAVTFHEQGSDYCRLETPENTPPGQRFTYRYAKGSTA